jgi:Na+-translocating ferredoxin:NAD+ oxidoreductase RNF subunit RnfB
MVSMRGLARGVAALAAATFLSVIGCSAGLSKADADARCDQEKAGLADFFNDKVYAACESCYEACGDNCVRNATSPISYVCPGDITGTGGSSSTSTTSTGN